MHRFLIKCIALAALMALLACGQQKPAAPPAPDSAKAQPESEAKAKAFAEAAAKEKEALQAGVEAVVYGLPLMIMDTSPARR